MILAFEELSPVGETLTPQTDRHWDKDNRDMVKKLDVPSFV